MPEVEGGEARQALESEHAALGALLFIAAVESAFQLHQQCALPSAQLLQRTPLAYLRGFGFGLAQFNFFVASPTSLQR